MSHTGSDNDDYRFLNDYRFLEDAYYGEGGFKDGRYLVQHPRETPDKYDKRKELSYYLNYVAPVVNSHVDPIFRTDAARDWGKQKEGNRRRSREDNKLFSGFFNDCDTVGTPLSKFMKRAARMAKLLAVAFIVVDNVADQPGNMADVLKKRAYPYCYLVKPSQVSSYTVNKAGKLTSISYTTCSRNVESGASETENWIWTETEWKVTGTTGVERKNNHQLGKVPVIPLFGKDRDPGVMKPQSEFYNIARTNKRLFNLCSEIDELIRNQAFNVLTYPMGESQNQEDVKEIIVGTENVWGYDGSLSHSPDFVAPDCAPLEQLRQERTALIEEIYRMAERSHVTGVQTQKSGVAKEWDFQNTNQTLTDFARNLEQAERNIADLFELWTNTTVDYSVIYSNDFGIVDVAAELDKVDKALALNIGGQFNQKVKKKAVTVYLNDLPEEEFDAVVEDIEAAAQDEVYQFDGASITSALDILAKVASKELAPDAAVILMQAFLGMEEERARSMVEAQKTLSADSYTPADKDVA